MSRSQSSQSEQQVLTADGVTLEPLYTEVSASTVAQRASAGWETWALLDPRRGDLLAAVERARRFGAHGLWLRSQDALPTADLERLISALDGLRLAFAPGSITAEAALVIAARATDGAVDPGLDPLSSAMRADDWSPQAEAAYGTVAGLIDSVGSESGGKVLTCSSLTLQAAGGDPVDELALLACGWLEALRRVHESGHDAGTLAAHTLFEMGVGSHLLTEIAKFRAARELLARVLLAERIAADRARLVTLQAVTSPRTLAASGWRNNALRATGQAVAAVLGGADRLVVLPWDDRLHEVIPGSDRLALQLQNVLRDEAHLAAVSDAGAGAFAVDSLTDQLGRGAWALVHEIEEEGGAWLSLRDGTLRRRAGLARHRRGHDIEEERQQIVGVNVYPDSHRHPGPAPAARGHGPSGDAYAPFFDDVLPGTEEES